MGFLNFGKKKEKEKERCCGKESPNVKMESCDCENTDIHNIKVLGSGCKSCHQMYENAKKAVANKGIPIEVEYVTDMEKVMAYGVMSMPGLVINENVVSMGKVLRTADIENLIDKSNNKRKAKPKVAFVCVHNSCRSQIAEALGKKLAADVFESYSAGTELKDCINPDAVRIMKKQYGIDMEQTQYNKLLTDIPKTDVVIFMGCNVSCPIVPSQYSENWGLDDPSGQSDEVFEETIRKIEENVLKLKERLA